MNAITFGDGQIRHRLHDLRTDLTIVRFLLEDVAQGRPVKASTKEQALASAIRLVCLIDAQKLDLSAPIAELLPGFGILDQVCGGERVTRQARSEAMTIAKRLRAQAEILAKVPV